MLSFVSFWFEDEPNIFIDFNCLNSQKLYLFFVLFTIPDHFQIVLVGWFTVGVRSSGYRAVSSTFHHWLKTRVFKKILYQVQPSPIYLCRKCEGEANVEEDEEDKGKQFFAKLVVIFLVGELVSVLHEGIGDCRQESGGSGGGPKIVQGRVTLWRRLSSRSF